MALTRHPCVVNFLGICTLPPAILTGKRELVLKRIMAAALAFGRAAALPVLYILHHHTLSSCYLLQSSVPMAPCTTCCAGRRRRPN